MPNPPKAPTTEHPRPSLTCDWQEWAAYLDGVDAPDDQKRRIIEELWNIVVAFVDLGWDVQSRADAETCGQTLDLAEVLRAAVLNSQTEKEEV